MSIALWCVLIAGLLPYVATAVTKIGGRNYDNNNPRSWLARQEGFRARAHAAHQNSWEAFALFTAAVLVSRAAHGALPRVDTLAMVFIGARLVYIPMYVAGWGALRSLVWAVGFACTVWIFLAGT